MPAADQKGGGGHPGRKDLCDIPKFHKMAVAHIKKGEYCYKYGEVIGEALEDLAPGDYVHVHNLASTRGRGDLESSHGGQN